MAGTLGTGCHLRGAVYTRQLDVTFLIRRGSLAPASFTAQGTQQLAAKYQYGWVRCPLRLTAASLCSCCPISERKDRCRAAAVENAEADAERECSIAAEHLKYVAEGGPAGQVLMDAYWARWDGQYWSSLIGYAWATALGFDLAHAALAQLLSDAESQSSSAAATCRTLLGCPAVAGKANPCDRTRVGLLRRLVSPRARQGDNAASVAGVDQVAVGRWLPSEAVATLAELALSVAQEPGKCRELQLPRCRFFSFCLSRWIHGLDSFCVVLALQELRSNFSVKQFRWVVRTR